MCGFVLCHRLDGYGLLNYAKSLYPRVPGLKRNNSKSQPILNAVVLVFTMFRSSGVLQPHRWEDVKYDDLSDSNMLSAQTVVVLGVLTVVGITLTGFGYELADQVLSWIGWLAGGAAGGGIGWFVAPSVIAGELPARIGLTAGAVIGGAILGRMLIPVATRLAMVIAGFLVSAGSVLLLFIGSDLTRVFAVVKITNPASITRAVEQVLSLAAFDSQTFTRTLVIAAVVGIFGAIVAARFYTVVLTITVSSIGAVLMGIVVPLWQQAIVGKLTLGVNSTRPLPVAVLGALVVGIAFQYYRHGDQVNLPFSRSSDSSS